MMLLCTDVGNTNIKFALYEKDRQVVKLRFATDTKKTDDEFAVELFTIFHINSVDVKKIDGSIISSVVPKVTDSLVKAIKTVTEQDSIVLGPGVKSGLDIRIVPILSLCALRLRRCINVPLLLSVWVRLLQSFTLTKISAIAEEQSAPEWEYHSTL